MPWLRGMCTHGNSRPTDLVIYVPHSYPAFAHTHMPVLIKQLSALRFARRCYIQIGIYTQMREQTDIWLYSKLLYTLICYYMLRYFFKLIIFIDVPRSALICINLHRHISDWAWFPVYKPLSRCLCLSSLTWSLIWVIVLPCPFLLYMPSCYQ